MVSHRPYRPALKIDTALEEIIKNRGIKYDPAIVDICQDIEKRQTIFQVNISLRYS